MLTHLPVSWAVDGPPVGDKVVGVSDAREADGGGADWEDWYEDQAISVSDVGGADWKDWAEDQAVGVGDAGGADWEDWYEDQAISVSDAGGADWKDWAEDKGVGEGDAWWAVVETVDDGKRVVSDRKVEFVM